MTSSINEPKTLLSVFSTFAVGGPQVRFAQIANHFGRRYRHVVSAMDNVYDCAAQLKSNLDIQLLGLEIHKGRTLYNRHRFRKLLQSIRPDCLVTNNWGTIEWGLANWPRLVRHIHIEDGFGPEEVDRQLPRRALTRRIVLGGSTIVVPSRQLQMIATQIWKFDCQRVFYVPNGVDCERFSKSGIEPLVARNGIPTIGTVAALRREKNLSRMLDAFRIIRQGRSCRLVIAGDGPERFALETRATALGLANDVVFTGYTRDTERVYSGIDVFMLSSDTEQMPTSVLEAMAAGLPIVSTNVGDVAGIVAQENSSFVVSTDAAALAKAATRLLDDDELRLSVGRANRLRVETEFTQERMISTYGSLFDGAAEIDRR
jgi:glycosyltransferase involved in cell wall biosynthesis